MNELTFENALRSSKAYSLIRSDLSTGLGHAYMVVSADDDVVDEFFTLVGESIYCKTHDACGECAECKKVAHNNHADVFHLYPTGGKIKVDDVETMLDTIAVKPLSDRKVYFVHRADLMNVQAQNKILKTLEEPPKDVTIFLGVANEASMLSTIKSRTRNVYIDLFDEDVIYSTMLSLGLDEEMSAIAAACSEGQLGKAKKIATSPKYAELYKLALYILDNLNRSSDVAKLDGLMIAEQDLGGLLDVMSIILRDMLVAKSNKDLMLSKHVSTSVAGLSEKYSARALANIIQRVNAERKKLSLNVSVAATVDDLLFSILEARYKWQ